MVKENTKVAEISVSYRPAVANKPIVISSLHAYLIFKPFFDDSPINLQESFMVMYMNGMSRILGVYPMYIGEMTGTVADIRLIFSVALTISFTSVLQAHNHPSGNMKSSKGDIDLTKRIKDAGKLLDIKLLDHLIISPADREHQLL
ncbi:MAG: repair protein [Ferruginibacter sp.]|uniref:JAB domain-containing protein n=1 Tax=Ferruginibacter sp. TaxID=1940288 RepID=UPI002658F228|nr:JAB domain-containing protein [Ferruginibacter sp.]MDB5276625.1 repair protein [Ferruginibacter sp.]